MGTPNDTSPRQMTAFRHQDDAQEGWKAAAQWLRRFADAHFGRWAAMEPREVLKDAATRLEAALPEPAADGITTFSYRNHEKKIGIRRVRIIGMRYGTSDYYAEPGYLLIAFDLDRQAVREFSLSGLIAPPSTE
jgi:hypothetical protein